VNSKTSAIIVFLVAVASFLGGISFTQWQYQKGGAKKVEPTPSPATPKTQGVSQEKIKEAFGKSFIKFGNADSKLVILEISDPSCPYCHVAAGLNGELNKEMDKSRGTKTFTLVRDGGSYVAPGPEIKKLVNNKEASFAYLYFPGHGNGEMGTKALYCAFREGKYWEVHDKLMTNEGYQILNNSVRNERSKAGELARFLKPVFDPEKMEACLKKNEDDKQLEIEKNISQELMVSASGGAGTPGFFINTTFFGGAYNFGYMEAAIKEALGK